MDETRNNAQDVHINKEGNHRERKIHGTQRCIAELRIEAQQQVNYMPKTSAYTELRILYKPEVIRKANETFKQYYEQTLGSKIYKDCTIKVSLIKR